MPFVQFKKREKHPWRSVTFSKVTGTKSNTPPWVFFTLLKLYKWYQIAQNTINLLGFMTKWFTIQKTMLPTSCANTDHVVTTFEVNEMV